MPSRSSASSKNSAKSSQSESQPVIGNPDFVRSSFIESIDAFNYYALNDIPPTFIRIPFCVVLLSYKVAKLPYLLAMMFYFDNFSKEAWLYTVVHGTYGLIWVIKELAFPNSGWLTPSSLGSLVSFCACFIAPFIYIEYLFMSGLKSYPVSNEAMFIALQFFFLGTVLMFLTDAQKYLVLRERRGLITHCMMGWSRNMNYFGETLIHIAFLMILQSWEMTAMLTYIIVAIFIPRMVAKDYSLSKKAEWNEYAARTWFFFPKLANSAFVSGVIYSLGALVAFYVFSMGGIEATVRDFQSSQQAN